MIVKHLTGAWSILYGQKIDIESKLANQDVQRLRREAKIAESKAVLSNAFSTEADKLNAEADIMECNSNVAIWLLNWDAARVELNTINTLMAELEPMRKYSHLPVLESTEACQQEEWKLELMARAENHMLSCGTIPAEELRFMRNHPEFLTEIAPHIERLNYEISNPTLTFTQKMEKIAPVHSFLLESNSSAATPVLTQGK